ncbi:hypothetical protein QMK28_28435, partial [Streptomyces sp. H27-D2]|nr:hypothetical protein [Streptomyces sp. H27-D2]
MVTFAQAQERAERWVNGDVPGYQHREVRIREFDLGFVAWAEDREGGATSGGSRARLVIARDSGETTLWPGMPVGEVIRRYEEEYAAVDEDEPVSDAPPPRLDLEATSFLLTPPGWLQEAADKLGIPDRRAGAASSSASSPSSPSSAAASSAAADSSDSSSGSSASSTGQGASPAARAPGGYGGGDSAPADRMPSAPTPSAPVPVPSAPTPSAPAPGVGSPWADVSHSSGPGPVPYEPTAKDGVPGSPPAAPAGGTPWAGTDTSARADDDRSVAPPATVFAPPLSGADDDDVPPRPSGVLPEAKTELLSGGSQLPRTAFAAALDGQGSAPSGPQGPGAPQMSPPPGAPGQAGSGAAGTPGGQQPGSPPPGAPGGGQHAAATVLSGPGSGGA